jgi:acetoin utilization deacetylase AcuC-like enzyme
MVEIFYSEKSKLHEMGSEHLESPKRLNLIQKEFEAQNDFLRFKLKKGKELEKKDILQIHTFELVNLLESTQYYTRMYLTPDTVTNGFTYVSAKHAAGTTYHAALRAYRKKVVTFSMVRPPGHHASSSVAMGFCFFNNIAIATQLLLEKQEEIERIVILDLDQHHGNGTQQLFYERDDVLYISIHADPKVSFPNTGFIEEIGVGRGIGKTVNIPIPEHTTDPDFLVFYTEIIIPIIEEYNPDLVLVSLGVDGLKDDPYGNLDLSISGYYMMGKYLSEIVKKVKNRISVVLEGGYKYDEMGKAVFNFFLGLENPLFHKKYQVAPELTNNRTEQLLREIKALQRNYWFSI